MMTSHPLMPTAKVEVTLDTSTLERLVETARFQDRSQAIEIELEGTDVIQFAGSDVGFVSVRRGPDTFVIETLCVAEAHRSRGLGGEIMRQFMADAAAAGASIEVFVLKANPRARAFYARLGFADAEQLPHHFRMTWPVAS